jgi:hypothetical protein
VKSLQKGERREEKEQRTKAENRREKAVILE